MLSATLIACRWEGPLRAISECMLSANPHCMQVPAEKRVYVHDEGKNDLGLARSWYRVAPVREYTADEWCDALLRGWYV